MQEIDQSILTSGKFGQKSRKPIEPKECKYCGEMVIWDYKLQGTNKFVDVNTREPHQCRKWTQSAKV